MANSESYDTSVGRTYRRHRYLISGVLIGMPLLTAASAYLVAGQHLQPSLSDYYFVLKDGGTPRTLFVVFLALLGGVLIAYRGLSPNDNYIHNTAAFFAFGVALFPMGCDTNVHADCVKGWLPCLHLPSAGLLFLSAMVSVAYSGGSKLRSSINKLANPGPWILRLRKVQVLSAALMVAGILAFFAHQLFPKLLPGFSWIFWIEYLGFLGFGIYWLRYMWFIHDLNQEGRRQVEAARAAKPPSKRSNTEEMLPLGYERATIDMPEAQRIEPPAQWVDVP